MMQAFALILPGMQGQRQSFPQKFLSWCIQWNRTRMLYLHQSLSSLHCPLTASQQNEGSSQASKGVTWYLVSEHLTYASPKCCLHPKSTTLASGEPARIGKCCEMTWSHLRTLPGVFLVNIIFCTLLEKLVYISVHAQHVWKRMTLGQWAQQETCDGFFAFFY